MLSNYIDGLYKIIEQEKEEHELARQKEAAALQTMHPGVKPLELQLVEFFRTLSPEQLNRPWTMDQITIKLQGKFHDHPHPQMVATELRKMGWQRRRLYSHQADGRRYWFPPGQIL